MTTAEAIASDFTGRQMQTQAFHEAMKQRNGIEGAISEFARN